MRVLMISKALVVGAYHKKIEELARLGVDLHVVLPQQWGNLFPEIERARGYRIHVLRCILHGKNHFHVYGGLERLLDEVGPDLVHIDEESYSTVTFQAMRMAAKRSIPALFFNWQNILKRFPFPFSFFEKYAFRHAKAAIAGNNEARDVLIRKGCPVPIAVIPQFGVDPGVFSTRDVTGLRRGLFGSDVWIVGYGGRLVEEKGLMVLLEAMVGLPERVRLLVIGNGPLRRRLEEKAGDLKISGRVKFLDHVSSSEMPGYLNCLDTLVLPSLTRRNWKEQFGRILIEAMACSVPVVGSNSGEIPHVVGDAGIIVPQGDSVRLREALLRLLENGKERKRLAALGRKRVEEHFTQQKIARTTFALYQSILQRA